MKYLSTVVNFIMAGILYYGPVLEGFSLWFCMLLVGVVAALNIFVFGMFAFGWSSMLNDPNSVQYFAPGSERSQRIYRSTRNVLRYYDSRIAFWLSVASSVSLMLGMVQQGWTVVLLMEIVASAIAYNFIHWASLRIPAMYLRAYGKEMAS